MLAALPEDELAIVLRNSNLVQLTSKPSPTPTNCASSSPPSALAATATTTRENAMGLRCVAAPIYDEFAEPLGAISLAGPIARLTDERILKLGLAGRAHGREITEKLGGVVPVAV